MKKYLIIDAPLGWALLVTTVIAIVSLAVSAQLGILLLLSAVLGWWVWSYPTLGFFFFIVISPLLPLLKVTQTLSSFTLIKDVIILTLVCRVAVLVVQKKAPYRRNVLFLPLLALYGWLLFGLLRADSLILGLLRVREIVLYSLLYIVVLYLPHTRSFYKLFLWWVLASFGVLLLLAAWQWMVAIDSAVLRFDPIQNIWIPRVSSTLGHPSVFGHYLIGLAAAGLALTLGLKRPQLKAASVGITLLASLGIYLTYSRAVWLGLLLAMICILSTFFYQRRRRTTTKISTVRYLLVGTVLAALGITILIRVSSVENILLSIFDPSYGSNEERLEFLARLIASTDNTQAIIGGGLGNVLEQNFREVNVTTYDITSGAARVVQLAKNTTLVDNQHLKTFIELGLIGLLIYIWLYLRVLKAAWSASRLIGTAGRMQQGVVGLLGVGFFTAFILQGFFIDIWDIFPTNAMFWIVAALVSAAHVPAVTERRPS